MRTAKTQVAATAIAGAVIGCAATVGVQKVGEQPVAMPEQVAVKPFTKADVVGIAAQALISGQVSMEDLIVEDGSYTGARADGTPLLRFIPFDCQGPHQVGIACWQDHTITAGWWQEATGVRCLQEVCGPPCASTWMVIATAIDEVEGQIMGWSITDLGGVERLTLQLWPAQMPRSADFDRDGDVDQEDYGYFQRSLTGPGQPQQ